jgi:HEAT repeat protein
MRPPKWIAWAAVWLACVGLAAAQAAAVFVPRAGASAQAAEAPAPAAVKAAPAEVVFHSSLLAAADAAARDGSLVLVVLETKGCPACAALRDQTLAAPEFLKQAGLLHVVQVGADTDAEQARAFEVTAVPDLVLMTGEQEIIARDEGFKNVADLVKWIDAGRRLAEQGLWEGVAAPGDADPAAAGQAETDDPKALVQRLGTSDPAARARATSALAARREEAMPALLDGLEDAYLGVRIGASDLVRKLAPASPALDPWGTKESRGRQVREIRQWWAATGSLPPLVQAAAGPEEKRSMEAAIEDILSAGPIRRTEGMSRLVWIGPAALPAVRDAIGRAIAADNQAAIRALEDVRWAILLPKPLESAVHARRNLARGTSEQRQAAARRLGGGGATALPALRELVDDPDPLVKESALYALKTVGGDDATQAMAVLLKVKDPGLRVAAAQSLGQTKSKVAAKHLAGAVSDPDESVATVAIAALEESGAKGEDKALIAALSDKRWRVRAAAAEVIGKLGIKTAGPELVKLLDDPDAFVVRSALMSLRGVGPRPPQAKLIELLRRQADLTGLAIELLAENPTAETLKTIETIYDESPDRRQTIMEALGRTGISETAAGGSWRSFLAKAAADKDPIIRRQLVAVLSRRTNALTTEFVERLLADEDADVRGAAAGLVLEIAITHWGIGYSYSSDEETGAMRILSRAERLEQAGLLAPYRFPVMDPELFPSAVSDPVADIVLETVFIGSEMANIIRRMPDMERLIQRSSSVSYRNLSYDDERKPQPVAPALATYLRAMKPLKDLHARWHAIMARSLDRTPDVQFALAFYVTGDGRTDLPVLDRLIERKDLFEKFSRYSEERVVGLVLARLPWPEARERVARWSAVPELYARMLAMMKEAPRGLRQFLCEEDRVVAAAEAASEPQFQSIARALVSEPKESAISLHARTAAASRILKRLSESRQPMARTLAVFVMSRQKGRGTIELYEKAMKDENPWARRAAIGGILTEVEEQAGREEKIGPLLADADARVAEAAAMALLDDNLRRFINETAYFENFVYGEAEVSGRRSYYSGSEVSRPLAMLDRRPAFLAEVRRRLTPESLKADDQRATAMALLLAQYGDRSGLDMIFDHWVAARSDEVPLALLVGLALTKDAKFLPALRKRLDKAEDESDLRQALTYLRGVTGDEARRLRKDINERLRTGARPNEMGIP